MGITSLTMDLAGQTNIIPRTGHMQTTDTLATITTAGYLNANAAGFGASFAPTDMLFIAYSDGAGSYLTALFGLSFGANGVITLEVSSSEVTLPTIANHIATYTNTIGGLSEDPATAISGGNIQAGLSGHAGYLASFPSTASKGSLHVVAVANTGDTTYTLSNAASAAARTVIFPDSGQTSTTAILADNATTQTIATGSLALTVGNITATAGNIQAGSSGHAGTLSSFPTTAAKGSLIIAGVANTGNTNVTISNDAHGQASVYSIPDCGNAAGQILNAATATPFTTGHLPAASGSAGLMVDSGVLASAVQLSTNIKAAQTADIGGGGAGPIAVSVAGLTSASIVTATIISSSNPVQVQTILPGSNTFGITFSGDPGASCIVSYVAFVAAQ